VIFNCANTTAFYILVWTSLDRGCYVKLRCKMGHCIKKVENQWLNVVYFLVILFVLIVFC